MQKNEEMNSFQPDEEDVLDQFAAIPNNLIRDSSMSTDCRWLICYLLSHSGRWHISIPYIMESQNIGRRVMYRILDEAIEHGYIKRDSWIQDGFKRYRYLVSRSAKFKKSLQPPEKLKESLLYVQNVHTQNVHTIEDQYKEYQSSKEKIDKKEKSSRQIQKKEELEMVEQRVFLTASQKGSLLKKANQNEALMKSWFTKLSEWKIQKGIEGGTDYRSIIKWVIGSCMEDSNLTKKGEERIGKDKSIAKNIESTCSEQVKKGEIYVSHDRIEFHRGQITDIIKYGDSAFEEKCMNNLRKMNLNTVKL